MPANRPSASFEPISPELDLNALVEETPDFHYADRISCKLIEEQGLEQFERLVNRHVVLGGKPLVIEGFQDRLDQWPFTPRWLRDNHGSKYEQARDITKGTDLWLSINHYLNNMAMLTNQWNIYNYREPDRQRLYLKDIDCPQVWHEKVKEKIPPVLFYLNESTGEIAGPGSKDILSSQSTTSKKGKGIAHAGDLMSSLPPAMRAENLMCYIGHEGTYTPAHREMCASLGQNIMVEASNVIDEDGTPTKPGSSIWFMTETKDRHIVSEYWLSTLGHDIEVEAHFAQINAWKAAEFPVYIVEQKVGDLILIPPLAPHQVWNRGTRTMKVAWNRTTVDTLELALQEALPRARMVCRDEQYKNKAIVLFTLQKYSKLLTRINSQKQLISDPQLLHNLMTSYKVRQLQKNFKRLFALYTQILLSETLSSKEKNCQYLPYDSNVTCSYCRCNIFNRFLTCTSCIMPSDNDEQDTYDVCLECYAMGRSCRCISRLTWVEQFPWTDLLEKHELWRHQVIGFEDAVTDQSPQSFHIVQKNLKTKTLAQVCQEQLKIRPWCDVSKPAPEGDTDDNQEEDDTNADGTPKRKRKKRRSEKFLREHSNCHLCKKQEQKWKLSSCSCGLSYCYGSLWRAFNLHPLSIAQDPDWQCPRCLRICSCNPCQKIAGVTPFEPTATILGHDTKKVADPRSVESLVDFSHSNILWVKKAGDDDPRNTRRLQRRRDEAAISKSHPPLLEDDDLDGTQILGAREDNNQHGDVVIDPKLGSVPGPVPGTSNASSHDTNGEYAESSKNSNERSSTRGLNSGLRGGIRGPFPSVAAMLDASPPPDQHQAELATSTDKLSRLESNPQDFIARAGLRNPNELSPFEYVAPTARMIDPASGQHGFTATGVNGIKYQFLDPNLADITPLPSANTLLEPILLPAPASHQEMRPKHKRRDDDPGLLSAFHDTPLSDANLQFRKAQQQQILAQAKRHGSFISTQAAISGQKLIVRLNVDSAWLSTLEEKDINKTDVDFGIDGASDRREDTIVVHSDLNQVPPKKASGTGQPPRKKVKRADVDEDFSTRKPTTRQTAATIASNNNHTRGASARYIETSEETEAESAEEAISHKDPSDFRDISHSKPRRSLPAYLTRRSNEVSLDVPKELSNEPKKRSSRKKQVSMPLSKSGSDQNAINERYIKGILRPTEDGSTVPDALEQNGVLEDRGLDSSQETNRLQPFPEPADIKHTCEPISSSQAMVDISTLGPSVTEAPDTNLLKVAEDNRKAKLKALQWSEADTNEFYSDSDSGPSESDIPLLPPPTWQEFVDIRRLQGQKRVTNGSKQSLSMGHPRSSAPSRPNTPRKKKKFA